MGDRSRRTLGGFNFAADQATGSAFVTVTAVTEPTTSVIVSWPPPSCAAGKRSYAQDAEDEMEESWEKHGG